ncbi:MAG: hypothetical protein WC470_01420 [Candidatus Paceibacterota bacterium]
MKKRNIIILAILAVIAVLAFSWFKMAYSKEVLKLEILGPDKADVGENIIYTVKFKNNGSVRLESPELFFTYPDGAIVENGQKVTHMDSAALKGDIYPGEERSFQFTTRLLGKTNETKQAQARMSFQPTGLKTKNEVSTTFTTILGAVPITLTIQMPDQVANGKTFTVSINYSSNVAYPLNDLTVKTQLADGFTVVSQKPKGLDNEWAIPVLNELDSGNIQLTGSLAGADKDKKIFKAQLGIWQSGNFVVLKEVARSVEIIAPSIYITQTINNSDTYVASAGDQLHYEISFINVGQDAIQNMVLISRLNSNNLNLGSIRVPSGNYQQGDNSIIWDGTQIPALTFLAPGQGGKVEFWVSVNKRWAIASAGDVNPIIRNNVTVGPSTQEFITKVNSSLFAEQKIYNTNQYFTNSGPYPLKVGQKTYLTVEWTAKNYYNNMEGVILKAVLSPNVDFENKIWPEDAKIVYDQNTREVTCTIGPMEAGAGFLKDAPKCAFQVSVVPELLEDTLITGAVDITGNDQWTGKQLNAQADPAYVSTTGQ